MNNKPDHSRRLFLKNIGIMVSGSCMTSNSIAIGGQTEKYKRYSLDQFLDSKKDNGDALTEGMVKAFHQLERTGGELQLPAGTFKINKPLTIAVSKDIKITGNNTNLIFDNTDSYCLTFNGIKTSNLSKQSYHLSGKTLVTKKTLQNQKLNLIIKENNYSFHKVSLTCKKLDSYTFQITAKAAFFNISMIGKNLVTSQNPGITFYILKFIDPCNVLVIPGNNQNRDLDLTAFNQWAIADLWCKSRGYYIKGEILQMDIKLKYQLQENYVDSNTSYDLFNSGKLTLNNLTINGVNNNCKYGLKLLNLDSVLLANLNIDKFVNNSLNVTESINVRIKSCIIGSSISGLPSNYACLIESSQKVNIENTSITGGFHGLSHGGTFPCRDIQISNSRIFHTSNWGLDFHGNCSNIKIDDVYCDNGAYIGGVDCSITRSLFYANDEKRAALVIGPERDSSFYSINSCKIGNQTGNAIAITSQFYINSIKNIVVQSNQILAGQNGIILQTYPYGNDPELKTLSIHSNTWKVAKLKQKNIDNHTSFKIHTVQEPT